MSIEVSDIEKKGNYELVVTVTTDDYNEASSLAAREKVIEKLMSSGFNRPALNPGRGTTVYVEELGKFQKDYHASVTPG